jgi:beta-lactam-binding protein with PASTA domain
VVPELHGLTLLDARRALHAAHCEVGAVHHAYSRHKKDRVYEQSVRKGTVWPSAHRVSVWDSLGSQPVS